MLLDVIKFTAFLIFLLVGTSLGVFRLLYLQTFHFSSSFAPTVEQCVTCEGADKKTYYFH